MTKHTITRKRADRYDYRSGDTVYLSCSCGHRDSVDEVRSELRDYAIRLAEVEHVLIAEDLLERKED
jgi:hypothetical protein